MAGGANSVIYGMWIWDENQDQEFNDIKSALITVPVSSYYDPAKEHKISGDASKSGIGSVLLQSEEDGWHPVHYGAQTLTKTEMKYAPIEREGMAMLFGVRKFHQYVFGKRFVLETDHKPLVSIFQGYLNEAPARLQSIMLKMQKYDYALIWVSRKYIALADSLSKHDMKRQIVNDELAKEIELHVNEVKAQVPVSDNMWVVFAEETMKCP